MIAEVGPSTWSQGEPSDQDQMAVRLMAPTFWASSVLG